MATETYDNAYLLSENYATGSFTTTEQISGSATIDDPTGTTLYFGTPFEYTDSYNTITLLYDGPVTENGVDVGFAGVDPATGAVYLFTDETIPAGTNLVLDVGEPTTICFMQGTAIATPDGERAVEDLAIGDRVCTADGSMQEVKWIGRQSVTTSAAVPAHVKPVRIRAGALGAHLPVRDLLVSADHALLIDGALVHASALVNGTTITRELNTPAQFTYYHIETESHALVLAEGVAAETFVDNAGRRGFDNYAEYEALYPVASSVAHMDRPRAKSPRQLPYAVRARMVENEVALAA